MWQYNYSNNAELYHYGVKGMKWGHRKAIPIVTKIGRRASGSKPNLDYKNTPEYQAKVARRKKALKIGATVAGTALAAYGTYKLAKYVQDKRNSAALEKAQNYVNQNFFEKRGFTDFANGSRESYFTNGRGDSITISGRGNKALGQQNARTIATARQMYKDATNTKLDRGLAKVVNAGDSVGRTANRAATSVARTANRAATSAQRTANRLTTPVRNAARTTKNRVLDVVNPIYEYRPGATTTKNWDVPGVANPIVQTTTNYYKTRVRRR